MISSTTFLLLCLVGAASGAAAIEHVWQIKLAQGPDPTSMNVTWSTDGTVSGNSHVIYGTDSGSLSTMVVGGPGKVYTYQSFASKTGVYLAPYTSPFIHTVSLTNLAPGTQYFYQCGDTVSATLSAVISFTTLPALGAALTPAGQPFTIAVMADTSFNGVVGTTSYNGVVGSTSYLGFMNLTVANIVATPLVGMTLLPGDMSYAGKFPYIDNCKSRIA